MFYIKSDDIDELFREAAEKYQVDTAGAEAWDDVKAAVHADDTLPAPPPNGNKKRRWFVLGWLLLIPLGWFAHNAWTAIQAPATANKTQQLPKTAAVDNQANKTVSPQAEGKKTGDNNTITAVATTPRDTKTANTRGLAPATGVKAAAGKQGIASMRVKQANIGSAGVNTNAGNNVQQAGVTLNNSKPNGASTLAGNNAPIAENNAKDVLHTDDAIYTTGNTKPVILPNGQDTANTKQSVLNGVPDKSNSTTDDKRAAAKQKSASDNGHYFYVGLSAAPDVSFIHMQKTSTLGTGAGIVLGYHINKNLSIETAALIEKKYYYTKGEYFNTSKIPYFVANNIHPETATGNCNMIEIPLNLKYTFKATGNNHFYAISGVSSYLMGHEKYTFKYIDWGMPQQGTWGYSNKANYLFSVLNVGVGYERTLGTKTNLRIEPYLKIPFTGFGTGSLKIASTGLYFTLTRKIF